MFCTGLFCETNENTSQSITQERAFKEMMGLERSVMNEDDIQISGN